MCVEQLRFYRKEIQHKRTVLGESDDLQHTASSHTDEDVTATQLSRRAVAEVVDHRNSSAFVRHFQERLK